MIQLPFRASCALLRGILRLKLVRWDKQVAAQVDGAVSGRVSVIRATDTQAGMALSMSALGGLSVATVMLTYPGDDGEALRETANEVAV